MQVHTTLKILHACTKREDTKSVKIEALDDEQI